MTYTIKTASWGNEDNTSAILNTEEVGHVCISERDTPQEWVAMLAWSDAGNVIRPYGEGSAYKAEKERQAVSAARKAEAEKKLAKIGLTVDDIKAVL